CSRDPSNYLFYFDFW
nr:immunoglobulin heavy chain junction region [Macaca mulatta]